MNYLGVCMLHSSSSDKKLIKRSETLCQLSRINSFGDNKNSLGGRIQWETRHKGQIRAILISIYDFIHFFRIFDNGLLDFV